MSIFYVIMYLKNITFIITDCTFIMELNEIKSNINSNLKIDRINYLFPPLEDYEDYRKLLISEEGLWSITPHKCAELISNIIKVRLGSDITIVDGTANIGGNTISFAKTFKKVISIEITLETYKMLQNNLKIYKLDDKVEQIFGDCIEEIPKIKDKIDVVFLDPPWGGRDYKKYKYIYLNLSGKNITNIIKKLKKHCKYVAIKIPHNFNFIHFFKDLDFFTYHLYKIHYKYYMIVIDMIIPNI